jgi:hypothetical protein
MASYPLPPFDKLMASFPNVSPASVGSLIGGHVEMNHFRNACTLRLSRALNYAGMRVPGPGGFHGLNVVSGADGRWYAYRVQEMRKWLRFRLGNPAIDELRPDISRSDFEGTRGIIAFDIAFADANGHLDLWDGATYTHEDTDSKDYFQLATRVSLWRAP